MNDTFQHLRAHLFSIAYRMLGSAAEAEDAVQDAYLRYLSTARVGIDDEQAWLRTVIIRLCLDRLKSARVQRETYIGPWLPEPVRTDSADWIDPAEATEQHDSLSLAFLLLLESLTPEARAVFLMRQVFEYEYDEIAAALGKSEAACRQTFSRARKMIDTYRPQLHNTPEEHRLLLEQCIHAFQSGDVAALMELLAEDVVSRSDGGGKAVAARHPLHGRDAVARFLIGLGRFYESGVTVEVAPINGRDGIIVRMPDGRINTVIVLTVANQRVQSIFYVRNPDKLRRLD